MNQNFTSGLGNIYCSEILFDSRVSPIREVKSLNDKELRKIIVSTKKILRHAIRLGGTTIKNFVVSNEKIGYFKNKLMVYGKEGLYCQRCAGESIIKRILQSGRSTFFCPRCQL